MIGVVSFDGRRAIFISRNISRSVIHGVRKWMGCQWQSRLHYEPIPWMTLTSRMMMLLAGRNAMKKIGILNEK
jgi:hypothetical protein